MTVSIHAHIYSLRSQRTSVSRIRMLTIGQRPWLQSQVAARLSLISYHTSMQRDSVGKHCWLFVMACFSREKAIQGKANKIKQSNCPRAGVPAYTNILPHSRICNVVGHYKCCGLGSSRQCVEHEIENSYSLLDVVGSRRRSPWRYHVELK